MVQILISHGDTKLHTPLNEAIRKGNLEIVKLLLDIAHLLIANGALVK